MKRLKHSLPLFFFLISTSVSLTHLRVAAAADIIVDDTNSEFTKYGPSSLWYQASIGYNGHIWWTRNNRVTVANYAEWRPNISTSGDYEVFAYIPSNYANTTAAPYTIYYNGGEASRTINQNNYSNAWVSLGTFNFSAGTSGYVKLTDATGERVGSKMIGFDAIKWVPLDPCGLNGATLQVTSPNGGETLYKGESATVTWSSSNLSSNVRIHLYKGGTSQGYFLQSLAANEANDGSFTFTVPSNVSNGSDYKIGMSNVGSGSCDGQVYDFSNSFFSIQERPKPNLKPKKPNDWSSALFPSNARDATGPGTLSACSPTYFNWAVVNNGESDAPSFNTDLYMDGLWKDSEPMSAISANSFRRERNVGPFTVKPGDHLIRINIDSANGVSESNESDNSYEESYSWNDCAPSLSITSPTNGSITGNNAIDISGTCTDDGQNLREIVVWRDANTIVGRQSLSGSSANFTVSNVALYTSGENTFQVDCTDTLNNRDTKYVTVVRNRRPSATIVSPQDGATTNSSSIGLNGRCTDADGNLDQVLVENLTNNPPWHQFLDLNGGSADFSTTVPLQPGSNRLRITCVDLLDLTGDQNSYVTYNANCPDGSPRDGTGDPCNHNDCSDYSATDPIGNPCNHDEDGDGILDGSDGCPFYRNDSENDPCNANDNSNLEVSYEPIHVELPVKYIDQSKKITIKNTGTGLMTYRINPNLIASTAPFSISLSRNGASTPAIAPDALLLPPGESDQFTVTIEAPESDPGIPLEGTIEIATNDTSNGSGGIPLLFDIEDLSYCPAAIQCTADPMQLLGNQNGITINYCDPINTATGNFSFHQNDLNLPGNGLALNFDRTYNSQSRYSGPLGFGWTHSYDISLILFPNKTVQIRFPDGHYEKYEPLVDGTYESPIGVFSELRPRGEVGGFELRLKDKTVLIFSTSGQLTEMKGKNNDINTLFYDEKNRLERVRDGVGRTLSFAYDNQDIFKIVEVSDAVGRQVRFAYENNDLIRVTDVLGGETLHRYDNHRLIQVTNPRGHTIVENRYDNFERVVEQKDGEGNLSHLDYETPELGRVTIADPLGQTLKHTYDGGLRISESEDPLNQLISYHFNEDNLKNEFIDQNGHSLRATYDEKGNLTSLANPLEEVTHYDYDSATNNLLKITEPSGHEINYEYDSRGNLTGRWEMLEGRRLERTTTYNELGQATQTTDENGSTTFFEYDSKGYLTSVKDPLGATTAYSRDDKGRVVSITDPLNHVTQYEYDAHDNVIKRTDTDGKSVRLTYDAAGNLSGRMDKAGTETTYTYNKNNLPTKVRNALGQEWTTTYDALNRRTAFTNPAGQSFRSTYDVAGNLDTLTDPSGGIFRFDYDPERRLVRKTGGGESWTYDYNNLDQLIRATDALGNETHYDYDLQTGQLIKTTDAEGQTTEFYYDEIGRLKAIKDALNQTTSYEYDDIGHLIRRMNPSGNILDYTYDKVGRLKTSTNGLRVAVQNFYDTLGNQIRFKNARGFETDFTYDVMNRVTKIAFPDHSSLEFTYDDNGRILTKTDPFGTTQYSYDLLGQLIGITHPSQGTTTFAYNSSGQVTSLMDKTGGMWSYFYDDVGRIIAVKDPLGNETKREFDPQAGRLVKVTDAEGHATEFHYDEMGRLTSITDPLNATISYTYDKVGRLIQLTDPEEISSFFAYDTLGRLARRTNASGDQEQFYYDPSGHLNRITDPRGQTTEFEYDAAGHLLVRRSADGETLALTYDENGNRLTRTDRLGTTTYMYNSVDRLVATTDPRGFSLGYEYNAAGLLSSLSYPGGKTTRYAYRPSGELSEVTDWLGHTFRYSYDEADRLEKIHYPNGFEAQYTYDAASRLTGLVHRKPDGTILSQYHLTLDRNGNRVGIDKDDNLTTWIEPEDVTATYNNDNELLSLGDLLFDYDASGNLNHIRAPGSPTSLLFDARNRLASLQSPGGDAAFTYDGDGNRISISRGGDTVQFVVDANQGLPSVIAETDSQGVIISYYVYGLGLTAQIAADGSQTRYFHYDPLGSTIALSDVSGNITDYYLYDEFGQVNRHDGETNNPFQFIGRYGVQNDGTGLYYMRARYYDPEIGRFISRDPLGVEAGLNFYEYVNNNPASFIDPSGLWCPQCAIAIVEAGTFIGTVGAEAVVDAGYALYDGAKLIGDLGGQAYHNTNGIINYYLNKDFEQAAKDFEKADEILEEDTKLDFEAFLYDASAMAQAGQMAATNPYRNRYKGPRTAQGRETEKIYGGEVGLNKNKPSEYVTTNPQKSSGQPLKGGYHIPDFVKPDQKNKLWIIEVTDEQYVTRNSRKGRQILSFQNDLLMSPKNGVSFPQGKNPLKIVLTHPNAKIEPSFEKEIRKNGAIIEKLSYGGEPISFTRQKQETTRRNMEIHIFQSQEECGQNISKNK